MKTTLMNPVKAFTLIVLGLAIAAMGIYVANADDAPGAAVIGMLLMVVGVVLGVRAARNRLPMWAARTALAVGVVVAAFAAFLTHGVVVTARGLSCGRVPVTRRLIRQPPTQEIERNDVSFSQTRNQVVVEVQVVWKPVQQHDRRPCTREFAGIQVMGVERDVMFVERLHVSRFFSHAALEDPGAARYSADERIRRNSRRLSWRQRKKLCRSALSFRL